MDNSNDIKLARIETKLENISETMLEVKNLILSHAEIKNDVKYLKIKTKEHDNKIEDLKEKAIAISTIWTILVIAIPVILKFLF